MEGALACAADYESALFELLQMVTPPEYQASVVGICADATALPLVPLSVNGRPLSELQGFADHPMPKSSFGSDTPHSLKPMKPLRWQNALVSRF